MIDKQYIPTSFQYFSNGNEDSYNILVVGEAYNKKKKLFDFYDLNKII